MKTICVIPARYASTRLPGKPLSPIAGKPMIRWVYERAKSAQLIDRVLVATDSVQIATVVADFGGQAVLTDPALPSGTDRVAAAVKDEDADIVINLQGDEPFIAPGLLDEMVKVFRDNEVQMATPVKAICSAEELIDPNLVRVARDKNGYALFFSRSVIPYLRDVTDRNGWFKQFRFYKHIGIYAYRRDFLFVITQLPESGLEKAERLEQLRVLENGYRIFTVETDYQSLSVDTPEDLQKVNEMIDKKLIRIE